MNYRTEGGLFQGLDLLARDLLDREEPGNVEALAWGAQKTARRNSEAIGRLLEIMHRHSQVNIEDIGEVLAVSIECDNPFAK